MMTPKLNHLTVGSTDVPLEKGKLRLYSMRFCPYAHRAHLILYAKHIPHDVVYVNLKKKPEWFLEKCPTGKVPALVIDDEMIYESLIMCDMLDEKYPENPMYPIDPVRKAKDRILIESFGRVISLLYKCYLQPFLEFDLFLPVMKEIDDFELELASRGTQFFAGDKPGMVDYMIWPWIERLDLVRVLGGDEFRVPKDRFKLMLQWLTRMLEDEAVKKHYVGSEEHAKFIQSHKAGTPDYDNIIQ